MSNYKRKKPKKQKQEQDNWSHKPELDPEPDPSRSGPVKKKGKRDWVVTGKSHFRHEGKGRTVYGSYTTKTRATQAMDSMHR